MPRRNLGRRPYDPAVPQLTRREERSDSTRRALLRAARALFARKGYAETSIDEIARRARVTHGALYHHFGGKLAIFMAVYEELQIELAERLMAAAEAEGRPELHLERGCDAFLDLCMEPDFQRICRLDAPSVLGWETMREVEGRYSLVQLHQGLEALIADGRLAPRPVAPLAHMLLGAMCEAAMWVARAEDPRAATRQAVAELEAIMEGLRT